jgi:beta-lactamase regulating signal transducer with metallopeptidase domain
MTSDLIRYLLALTLASSVGIIPALLLRRAAQRMFGPAAAYCMWLFVPVAIAAVFVPQARDTGSVLRIAMGSGSVSALSHVLDVSAPGGALPSWHAWAVGAWATGAVLFVLYLAALQRVFVRSLGRLRGSRCVVKAERSAGCPALLGVLRPRIILPADFKVRYSRRERLLILAHERAHLRRGDPVWNAFAALLRCVVWFNPLVHLASPYFRVDQELACDAAVLKDYSGSRRTYASAMLKTELADTVLPVGCHWRSVDRLKERLQMIKKAVPSRQRRAYGYVFVALASLIVGCSTRAVQPAGPTSVTQLSAPLGASTSVRVFGEGLTFEDSGDVRQVAGPELQLTFRKDSHFRFDADRANVKQDGTTILEGHVRITSRVVRVIRSGDRVVSTDVRPLVANGEKAEVTRESDGGLRVRIENGNVQL